MIRILSAVAFFLGAALALPTADARNSTPPEELVKDRLKTLKGEAAVFRVSYSGLLFGEG
jgi:hypothetical protein